MAFTVQSTAFGLMMIWMGMEIGEYKEKTPGMAKIDWSLIEDREDNSNAINKEQLQYCKNVIYLRRSNPALTTPNFEFIFEDESRYVLAWHRWSPPVDDTQEHGNHVVIVGNWAQVAHENYQVSNIPFNGLWYEWLNNNKEYKVENNILTINNLKDHTARVFIYQVKRKVEETPATT